MNLKQIITKTGKYGGLALAYMNVESYINGKINQIRQNKLNELIQENKDLAEKYNSLLENQIENETLKSKLISGLDYLKDLRNANQININKIQEKTSQLNNNLDATQKDELNQSINYYVDELSKEFQKENKSLHEIIDSFIKSIDNGNNFINLNINDYINQYKEFLSTLTLEQTGALANISCAIVIFFCLLTLISIFFSEILLNYFNLEKKYPRIANFILIRQKFQKYYFIVNSLIIFILLITIIFINILAML